MSATGRGIVRRIWADEGPTLRTVRLAALASDPLAFGSTFQEEEPRPAGHWAQRAEAGATTGTDAIFFIADPEAAPYGMVGAFTHEGSRYLWGMWVAPERRGQRAGEALLDAVLEWCRQNPGEKPVRLDVNPSQIAALKMYQRHGFRRSAEDRPLGHHPPATKLPMELVGTGSPSGSVGGFGEV